jgi:predicted extracellular nuclease
MKRIWGLTNAIITLITLGAVHGDLERVAEDLTICAIQGAAYTSPHIGELVTTRGIVHADFDLTAQRGFFLQDEPCDGNPSTSDGIFIYLGERLDLVDSGDEVQVTGLVQEYYGLTEIVVDPGAVAVLTTGNPLPAAQELNPPFLASLARAYFESLEGMRVGLEQALVVGPTDADDRTWLVRADLGIQRVFQDDPAGTGELICVDDGGLFEITPEVRVGQQVTGLAGVLDFRYSEYCMELTAAPAIQPAALVSRRPFDNPPVAATDTTFEVATFNLANLFDTVDDPLVEDSVLSATEYQRRLHKRALAIHAVLGEPVLLAVQEAENLSVLQDLLSQPEIQAAYDVVTQDGPDLRGLDIALLYQTERAQVLEWQVRQGCTTLIDGLGPDGNSDVTNPQNLITCDSDDDGVLDGNRLFSRPPLMVHLQVCESVCPPGGQSLERAHFSADLWLIVNHWKSKTEDTDYVPYTLQRRVQQAQFVGALAQEVIAAYPSSSLVVLGDLNDFPTSQPLLELTSLGLADLTLGIEKEQRYTYIYRGVSQVLDYALVRLRPTMTVLAMNALHINADFPYVYMQDGNTYHRSSDHDAVCARFGTFDYKIFLPVVGNSR